MSIIIMIIICCYHFKSSDIKIKIPRSLTVGQDTIH